MDAPRNILILSSSTGGGHRSAAEALKHSFLSLPPGTIAVKVSEVLDDSHPIPRLLGRFYNYLLQRHQNWMKYYFAAIHRLRPNESRLLFKWMLVYRQQLLEGFRPDAVVSVHPMIQHFCGYLLEEHGLADRVPLVTVVTDPYAGFWRGWVCEAVQQYFVATEEARQQLSAYGVSSEKVKVSGMPVHARFAPVGNTQRQRLRRGLGLDPNKFTVFVNAGWAGGGNIPRIYRHLLGAKLDIQAVFVAGQNERLAREAHALSSRSRFPVRVLGYSRAIQEIMNLSDVMISKPGGLTVFEAIACRTPVILDGLTPPMPQEEATAHAAERAGYAVVLHRLEEVTSIIRGLQRSPEWHRRMREAAGAHATQGAARRIAEETLAILSENRATRALSASA